MEEEEERKLEEGSCSELPVVESPHDRPVITVRQFPSLMGAVEFGISACVLPGVQLSQQKTKCLSETH